MSTVRRFIRASPQRIWTELSEGWNYASWVVGASHIRDVDEAWPEPGSRIHHAVGPWPLVIRDTTTVSESDAGRRLLLRARMWPVGEAAIELRLEPDGEGTAVTMTERLLAGPGRYIGLLVEPLLVLRNAEALSRLAARVENR